MGQRLNPKTQVERSAGFQTGLIVDFGLRAHLGPKVPPWANASKSPPDSFLPPEFPKVKPKPLGAASDRTRLRISDFGSPRISSQFCAFWPSDFISPLIIPSSPRSLPFIDNPPLSASWRPLFLREHTFCAHEHTFCAPIHSEMKNEKLNMKTNQKTQTTPAPTLDSRPSTFGLVPQPSTINPQPKTRHLISILCLLAFCSGCQVLTYSSPTGERFTRSSLGSSHRHQVPLRRVGHQRPAPGRAARLPKRLHRSPRHRHRSRRQGRPGIRQAPALNPSGYQPSTINYQPLQWP